MIVRNRLFNFPDQKNHKLRIYSVELHWERNVPKPFKMFNSEKWAMFCRMMRNEPDSYVAFPGDIINFGRHSTRKMLNHVLFDRDEDRETLEDGHRKSLEPLIESMMPFKDRIIGMVDGDHYVMYNTGMTSTQYICNSLGIPDIYLGERMGGLRFQFRFKKCNCQMAFWIKIQHGVGGTGKQGISKMIDQAGAEWFNLFCFGHNHKLESTSLPPILYYGKNLGAAMLERKAMRAGSFLESRNFQSGHPKDIPYSEVKEYGLLNSGYQYADLMVGRSHENGSAIIKSFFVAS